MLYLFTLIGELLVTSWTSKDLPLIYFSSNVTQSPSQKVAGSVNIAVAALHSAEYFDMAAFLNGCYIFSALSASNSALYVASRTLYGLSRGLPPHNYITRPFRKLSTVFPRTRTPARALLVSMLSFFWLPFITLAGNGNPDTVNLV